MSDGFYADVSELNTLAIALTTAGPRVGAMAAVAVRKTAHEIEATGKVFAPVDTGYMRSSIGVDMIGDGRSGSIGADIGPTADYSEYVELGTSRMAPQAFMGPAFDRHAWELSPALVSIGATIL
jgi:HK97 gp10 family phage protein